MTRERQAEMEMAKYRRERGRTVTFVLGACSVTILTLGAFGFDFLVGWPGAIAALVLMVSVVMDVRLDRVYERTKARRHRPRPLMVGVAYQADGGEVWRYGRDWAMTLYGPTWVPERGSA